MGRGAQAGTTGRRVSAIAAAIVVIVGCARRGAPPPTPSPPPPPWEVREATLLDGGVTVRVQIPPGPPGRKPAVIGSVPDPAPLLAAGAVVVPSEVPPAP